MPFDAADLYWPPFRSLFDRLEAIKLEPEAVEAASLKSSLQEYSSWLAKGLGGFKKPNDVSKKALDTESHLSVGSQKLPVEAGLRSAALATSRALNLDEVQAYILLRRWYRQAAGTSPATAAGTLLVDGHMSPSQLRDVAVLYSQERLCLLQSIEDLLWLGEGASGEGPFGDVVEETLVALVDASPGLEEVTVDSLKENLEGSSALSSSNRGALAPIYENEEGAPERNVMLTILMLIYFHPRKQCTPARFLELARLFHTRMFTQPQYLDWGRAQGVGQPALLSVKLATLLLLEVLALDIEKPLEALAAGDKITPDAITFLEPNIHSQVDNELRSWWPAARPAHAPLFLVWSALQTLGKQPGAEDHAARAYAAGVLSALCQLSSAHGLHPSATEMAGTIVFSTMSAVLAAFGLEPLTMSVPDTEAVVKVLSNIFQGQHRLCLSFWQDEDAKLNLPVRHFLESLADMYPALPDPMLRLLCALSSGSDAAAAANAYLACLQRLTCMHVLPDPACIGAHNEDPGMVVTEQPLSLPGAQSLTFPAGIVGEIVDLPPEFSGTWTAGPDVRPDSLHLIRWRLTVPDGTAQWVLLCRGFEALRAVQTWHSVSALKELDASLSLLAAVCAGDPATAMELLHVEAPVAESVAAESVAAESVAAESVAAESVAAEGARGPDLLLFAGQAVAVLAAALSTGPHGPNGGDRSASSALAHALRLFAALAPEVPGRVADELIAALGITPLAVSLAGQLPGAAQEAPLLRAVVAAENAAGEYPATLALLQLLSTLLQAGRPSPGLAPLVAFVAQRVMPELQHWRFSKRAQRWQLATACLSVTRHALLVNSDSDALDNGDAASTGASSSLAAAVVSTLSTDAGTSACLLPLLPPDASTLEAAAQNRQASDEVEAAEQCCVAWLRLIPVLFPPLSPNNALSAEPFLRGRADGGRAPAAALLSFLIYPYFGTRERALVVRSVHCFAIVAATVAPDVPMVGLLPQGSVGVTPAVKAVFEQAISPAAAHASHALFGAACDVLIAALRHHPSMLDALMFPALMESTPGKENKSDNPNNSGAIVQQKKGKAAHSCLDDLWSLLQRVEELADSEPYVAARALKVVAAMWQSGGPATRAMLLLRQQEGFWKAIIGVVQSAAAAGPIPVPAIDDDGHAEAWSRLEKDCWRVTAEAYAMQIIAAEWYMWASGGVENSSANGKGHQQNARGGGGGGAPTEVVEFVLENSAAALPGLLKRYCAILPSASLLKDTHRVAAAAGLQLLSTAVQDSALWATFYAGTSFISSLAAAAQEAVGAFDSSTDAAAGLARRSSELISLGGQMRGRAMHAVADGMLALAEVPGRVASDQEYGRGFAYDGTAFIRRIGSALAHACPTVMDMQSWLAAASVAASLEDACLSGAAAVDAFASIVDGQLQTHGVPGKPKFTPSDSDVTSALGVLSHGVEAVAQEALSKVQNEADGGCTAPAIEVSGVHIAGLASAAQVCLVMLSRHVAKDAPAGVALCAHTLGLTGAWLNAERAATTEDPESSSRISLALLAAALHTVSAVSTLNESNQAIHQDVSHAAQHLLPSLFRVMSEGGHLSVPATSLAAGIIDKILPSSVWLPIFERGIHMGSFLTRVLDDVASSKRSSALAADSANTDTTTTAGSSTAQESAMLLALQVAQIPAGAALLVEQGVLQLAVALCSWLQAPAPSGGNLLGESIGASVDYSNAYATDGTPNPVHRLWCSTLALVGLLAAALPGLPGHAAAEGAAMQVAIGMDARLQLAIEPPEGSKKQPLTLAMAQEAKYALFLVRGTARADGEWRLALPHALPAMRRASASLLRFAAEALDDGTLVCGPVSPSEHASAKAHAPSSPLGGWFQRCVDACGTHADSGNSGTPSFPSAYGWEMAERFASCVQYALAFQLETAPEVSEPEVASLGPEWVHPDVVRSLAAGFQEVVADASGATARTSAAGKRVLRTSAAVLKTCLQLLDLMSVRLGAAARQELQEDILAAAEHI